MDLDFIWSFFTTIAAQPSDVSLLTNLSCHTCIDKWDKEDEVWYGKHDFKLGDAVPVRPITMFLQYEVQRGEQMITQIEPLSACFWLTFINNQSAAIVCEILPTILDIVILPTKVPQNHPVLGKLRGNQSRFIISGVPADAQAPLCHMASSGTVKTNFPYTYGAGISMVYISCWTCPSTLTFFNYWQVKTTPYIKPALFEINRGYVIHNAIKTVAGYQSTFCTHLIYNYY